MEEQNTSGAPAEPAAASQPPQSEPAPAAQAAAPPVDELSLSKARADEYLAGWKRALADYANLQKAAEKAREDVVKFACAGIVGNLVPVLEGFRKAAGQVPAPGADEAALRQWIDGVKLIEQQLENVLKKAGLSAVAETGVAFDPVVHEAMMARKQEGVEPGKIIEVLEAGYRLHDRVIRPAKVVVSE